ncbi:rhamnogalacturonan acetylesterase [Bacillus sp. JCM 19034]|uniref:rhamnogalacturonan acetylesterase n=1 Tax=Bacillus sp. JCM 19034 TaxID=1481928 RepID=UPI000785E9E1|nr:rhamnogalacturonan acetylesterase [Bacillus sp. JCM 19034]
MTLLEGFKLIRENNNVVFLSPDASFSPLKGYGFLFHTPISNDEDKKDSYPGNYTLPFTPSFIIDVENGHYDLEITFGSDQFDSNTTVIASAGQRLFHHIYVPKGQLRTMTTAIAIENKELRLAFVGMNAAIRTIKITRNDRIRTIFLAGDSTVVDQASSQFPFTGWGQFLPCFISAKYAISNHARSGRSTKSFIEEQRLAFIEKSLKANDLLVIQFGHNDEKDNEGGTEPYTTFSDNLELFIQSARKHHAIPILVSPVHRRKFDQNGYIINTHGDYIVAMKQIARKNQVPFIDLSEKSKFLFEKLGPHLSKNLFMWLEPSEFGNHPDRIIDDTHFSELGAFSIAKLVAEDLHKEL